MGLNFDQFISSPEPKAYGELIVYRSIRRPSVRASVNIFKLQYLRNQWTNRNQILSEASLGRGKDALGFGPDRIRTLESMATDSSHRVIMGKCVHSSAFIFDRIFFILAGNKNIHNISDKFEIRPDRTKDCGVSCP